ncbi:MAG: hypothetical protein JXA06_11665 [Bacteroidetes bacterium]|nr:hypothetical protein [Bacteroidota bacterium]
MKNNIFAFTNIGLMIGILLTGCDKTSEQRKKNVNENVIDAEQKLENAQAEFEAEWQAFKSESEKTIAANEQKIDAFKKNMEKAGSIMKAKYIEQVAVLEQKNIDLKKKLADYKDEGQSKWQEFKTNFKNDMDAIGKTMTDLFSSTD